MLFFYQQSNVGNQHRCSDYDLYIISHTNKKTFVDIFFIVQPNGICIGGGDCFETIAGRKLRLLLVEERWVERYFEIVFQRNEKLNGFSNGQGVLDFQNWGEDFNQKFFQKKEDE